MGKLTPIADLAKLAFRVTVQPALFVRKRAARYRMAGVADAAALPVCRVHPMTASPSCVAECAYTQRLSRLHLAEYRAPGGAYGARPWLGTACVIPLAEYGTYEAYAKSVGRRTADAVHRSGRKASRKGYVTGCFHPPYFAGQMSAILSSKRFRSGGLVPYGLLGGAPRGRDHGQVSGYRPQPPCPLHWTLHWGVFATRDGDQKAVPPSQWTLSGFVKVRRIGSLVHALQIMTHGDHLRDGANDLMHMDLIRWLIENPDGVTGGVAHYLYGALEHAGDGLALWKLRRGFQSMLVEIGDSHHFQPRGSSQS